MNKNRLSLTHTVLIAMALPVSIFIVSMLLGCNSPHNSKYISVANEGCPQFEKQFPMKQATIGSLFSGKEDGCPEVIEYSSMAEAEWKMIHYFFPNGKPEILFWAEFDYDLFKQIVLSDTSSMAYPFDSLMQYANITISDSDDGQLRVYSWEPGHSWQLSDYHNVFQYRWEGTIKTCEPECEGEDCTQAGTNAINTFYRDGKAVYVFSNLISCGNNATTGFESFVLSQEGLQPIQLFKDADGEFSEELRTDYFGFLLGLTGDNSEVATWDDFYDKTHNTFFLPASTSSLPSNRYNRYIWDGNYFTDPDGQLVANPFLWTELTDYEFPQRIFETEKNLVRIDCMPDDSYRYAAWKRGDSMMEKPEIIILNGRFDPSDSSYVFSNEGCEYRIGESLRVLKNGSVIKEWGIIDE